MRELQKIIVFITYESPWFPAGGIAAVMGQLPCATASASGMPTVVLTPFHMHSTKMAALPMQQVGSLTVAYKHALTPVTVHHLNQQGSWYFLQVDQAPPTEAFFFAGTNHPYDVASTVLLRDALFFGAAAVQALPVIAKELGLAPESVEWNLVAQDWEAATALLAFVSQQGRHGRLHLTLHNSYDQYAAPKDLTNVGIQPDRCPGSTILHRALSVIEQPAFTVSDQFALEFTHDLLQCEVMTPHLQALLEAAPVVGVDNGPFKTLAVDADDLRNAGLGNFAALKAWKDGKRQAALDALAAHTPSDREPVWGDKDRFRRDEAPWVVMAGRDDPRQKGYDVAALAVEDYLSLHHGEPDCAQFLFFPIPGDEGTAGLVFLQQLADHYPEDVLVFPFIWIAGFMAALQGAAYGLMPSLYEPFGMANEFYLAGGCVGIGRATGGNLEQIVPLRAAAAFSRAVQTRADRYHALSAHPTGILFREKDAITTARADWGGINDAQYLTAGASSSRVAQRKQFTVYREMATELRIAIDDGMRVYRQQPELYYRMLSEGIAHIQRTFSWQRAGAEYARKIR